MAQERPQPGGALGVVGAAEPVALFQGSGQRLLHEVFRVELAAEPAVELHPRQQEQVVPERLQPPSQLIAIVRHGFHALNGLNDGDSEIERTREGFEKLQPGVPIATDTVGEFVLADWNRGIASPSGPISPKFRLNDPRYEFANSRLCLLAAPGMMKIPSCRGCAVVLVIGRRPKGTPVLSGRGCCRHWDGLFPEQYPGVGVARFGVIDRISQRRRTVSGSMGTRCSHLAGSQRTHSAGAES